MRRMLTCLALLACAATGPWGCPGGGSVRRPADVPGDGEVTVTPGSVCVPCADDADCDGGLCRAIGGEPVCTYACVRHADCPRGFRCWRTSATSVEQTCQPASWTCSCTPANEGETRPCEVFGGSGTCPGTETCDPWTGWVCTARAPVPERCDGTDDDCDGETDEDFRVGGRYVHDLHCGHCGSGCADAFPGGSGRCTTAGTGEPHCVLLSCDPGYLPVGGKCVESQTALCAPCDEDADCDGGGCVDLPGEGAACSDACGGEAGCPDGYECLDLDGGRWCLPPTASCDCTPENAGLTRPCSVSSLHGSCHGFETCTGEGWSACSAPTPVPEDCNGLDDDCDGGTDEDVGAPPCEVTVPGLGTCEGTRKCLGAGGWTCDAPTPGPEACDFEDNDCDGVADDPFRDPATGQYTLDEHCGGCGNDCGKLDAPHATGRCEVAATGPGCVPECDPGWVDRDGVPGNGCECEYLGADDPPDGVDQDCDGIDGEPGNAVFVAEWGIDQSPGTAKAPVRSIQRGIDVAGAIGKGHVYVAGGTYDGTVVLAAGRQVFGGFADDFSTHDPAKHKTLVRRPTCGGDRPGTVNAACDGGALPVAFVGFVVEGPTCTGPGETSYGIWIRNCGAELRVAKCEVRAGHGGPGASGAPGGGGQDGVPGKAGMSAQEGVSNACTPQFKSPGGAGGKSSCDGVAVDGGAGGTAVCPDFDESHFIDDCPVDGTQFPGPVESGAAGLPSGKGGAGGTAGRDSLISVTFQDPVTGECSNPAWACGACVLPGYESHPGSGVGGTPGGAGDKGSGCSSPLGQVVGGVWSGVGGKPGGKGSHGGGGGGGGAAGGVETSGACPLLPAVGNSDFGGSGGGGSGGCGGAGGTGGQAGGASFGVFMTFQSPPSSVPDVEQTRIVTGIGGSGGAGGANGLGGAGGPGGAGGNPGAAEENWCAEGGGEGGDGGSGGHGGGGGGGCGGASIGLFVHGAPAWTPGLADLATASQFELAGGGGAGGPGGHYPVQGAAAGAIGAAGVHQATNL